MQSLGLPKMAQLAPPAKALLPPKPKPSAAKATAPIQHAYNLRTRAGAVSVVAEQAEAKQVQCSPSLRPSYCGIHCLHVHHIHSKLFVAQDPSVLPAEGPAAAEVYDDSSVITYVCQARSPSRCWSSHSGCHMQLYM